MFALKFNLKIVVSPQKLVDKMNKANEQAVRRSGPIIRGIMRRSIRYRAKKRSEPGRPPFSHTKGGFGLKMIVYKFSKGGGLKGPSMLVGPVLRTADVPGVLEKGGRTSIKTRKGKTIQAYIKPRPFATPSLLTFKTKYPDLWRNSII